VASRCFTSESAQPLRMKSAAIVFVTLLVASEFVAAPQRNRDFLNEKYATPGMWARIDRCYRVLRFMFVGRYS
jgi:hypothetical protein